MSDKLPPQLELVENAASDGDHQETNMTTELKVVSPTADQDEALLAMLRLDPAKVEAAVKDSNLTTGP